MSDRIDRALATARAAGRAMFVPFWVLGDPDEESCLAILRAMIDAGADALELGIPFSDPPADGPIVQAAGLRALEAGMTPPRALSIIATLRRETAIPLVLLVYANLVEQHDGGVEGFARAAAEAGLDAILIPDAPLEEAGPYAAACARHGVSLAQMVTETTSEARLARIAEVATGYLYVVSRPGTTGTHAGLGGRLAETIARARQHTTLPLFAGFGISTRADVLAAQAAGADATIVGSALIAGSPTPSQIHEATARLRGD